MSPRVPTLKPRKVIRTFQNAGYILDHIEGSHYYFTHPTDRTIHFSVAHHTRDMKRSTTVWGTAVAGGNAQKAIQGKKR